MASVRKVILVWAVLFAILIQSGCVNAAGNTDQTQARIFKSDFFGFTLKIPDNWHVQSQQAVDELLQRGADLMAGDDKNKKALYNVAKNNTLNLIMMFKYPLGAPVNYNPSMTCVAENVSNYPGIQRGEDYLFSVKRALANSAVQMDIRDDFYSEKIGGVRFDVMETHLTVGSMTVNQKYYAAILRGYALNFIISYSSAKELQELRDVIKSIKFETAEI